MADINLATVLHRFGYTNRKDVWWARPLIIFNGMPKLMCMTRLSDLNLDKPVLLQPMKAFPIIKDLVTDVSWNFRVKKKIKKFKPRKPVAEDGTG